MSRTSAPMSDDKSIPALVEMICQLGWLPKSHAGKYLEARSVLPIRGGVLMARRLILPLASFSRFSQMSLWYHSVDQLGWTYSTKARNDFRAFLRLAYSS